MCLDYNSFKEINPPIGTSKRPLVRYKILRKSVSMTEGDLIKFSNRNYEHKNNYNFSIKLNEWMIANQREIGSRGQENSLYISGFHIFKSLKDALEVLESPDVSYLNRIEGDTIFKVEVKEIYLEGKNEGFPCQVAKYMRVIKEIVPKIKKNKENPNDGKQSSNQTQTT